MYGVKILKWVVAILVGLNAGIFLYMELSGPASRIDGDDGRLPRVAEIELIARAPGPGKVEMAEAGTAGSELGDSRPLTETTGPVLAENNIEVVADRVVPDVGDEEHCTVMGWFDDEASALAAAARLSAELNARVLEAVAVERPLDDFYWVLIPPLADRSSALTRSRELSAQGIESYAVPSGEYENGISLGLFRSRTSAERILAQRTEQNIEARLVILPRNRISYALVFEGALELIEIPADALSLGENGQWIRVESGDCESVASTNKNP